jgi:hypothetical protein
MPGNGHVRFGGRPRGKEPTPTGWAPRRAAHPARMAKTDLRARPIFHRERDAIEAHLTVVFAALAVSRHLQEATGVSIIKLVQTLRAVRSATVRIGGQDITLDPDIPPTAQALLDRLARPGH